MCNDQVGRRREINGASQGKRAPIVEHVKIPGCERRVGRRLEQEILGLNPRICQGRIVKLEVLDRGRIGEPVDILVNRFVPSAIRGEGTLHLLITRY